jgi:glycosyltransferase involved in cell wall biosynthesis
MKIVVVSCVSPPETVVAGRANYDICTHMSSKGHNVTLITPFPSRPLGKFMINNKEKVLEELVNENFRHVRIKSYKSPEYGLIKRVYESFDFGLKSMRYINNKIDKCDLIYATPWPFIGQFMFLKVRKNKAIPVIMNVQDLYPESFLSKYNSLWTRIIRKGLTRIDRYIASESNHLTVVSESMKKIYIDSRDVVASHITVIENWQDEEMFINTIVRKNEVLKKYSLDEVEGKFIFMYLGNIGPVAGLEIVLQEYGKLVNSNSCIIIAGSGTAKQRCMEIVESDSIENVLFLEIPTGLESVVELQGISDVLLLPIHPEASASSIPSKLIAYMFSSKPILSSAKASSTTAKAISESKSGLLVDGLNPWSMQMSKYLNMDKKLLTQMGQNSFEYGISSYSKKIGLTKVEDLFNNVKLN